MNMNDGGPAFPQEQTVFYPPAQLGVGTEGKIYYYGMSLRDYFAAKAMPALITSTGLWAQDADDEGLANAAYCIADAMLRERGQLPQRGSK